MVRDTITSALHAFSLFSITGTFRTPLYMTLGLWYLSVQLPVECVLAICVVYEPSLVQMIVLI